MSVVCECGIDQGSGNNQGPTPGIMVWGAIAYNDHTPVVSVERTLNSDSKPRSSSSPFFFVIPTTPRRCPLPVGQFPCTRVSWYLTHSRRCASIPVTARSHMSAIEHLWDIMGWRLVRPAIPTTNLRQLQQQVELACNTIPQDDIQHICDRVYARLQDCTNYSSVLWGRNGVVIRLLVFHQGVLTSILGEGRGVSPRIFACVNSAGQCRWSESFPGDLPFPPPLAVQRRSGVAAMRMPTTIGDQVRFPGGVTAVFLHVGIEQEYAAVQRVFPGISRLPHPCIPALLHNHLAHPPRLMKTSILRAAQTLDSTVLCTLELRTFVHWLLLQRAASVTPHLVVRHSLLVSLHRREDTASHFRDNTAPLPALADLINLLWPLRRAVSNCNTRPAMQECSGCFIALSNRRDADFAFMNTDCSLIEEEEERIIIILQRANQETEGERERIIGMSQRSKNSRIMFLRRHRGMGSGSAAPTMLDSGLPAVILVTRLPYWIPPSL
ncbi:hypothetical protein PR048_014652 [Dryococelus australis]|uniref:Uncharacterized protein n=1 Tax=Dryococelus australis TaxID=614101 RepID=A0ABQ9HEU8_9NEOP|nr:hypothetical protein PR048_014652 [Dryococelus australis]